MTIPTATMSLTRRMFVGTGLAALATLSACTNTDDRPQGTRTSPETSPETSSDPTRSTAPSAGSKTLLAFFSRPGENYWNGGRRTLDVGNTERLARMISDRVSCDSYQIRAADPYPDAYDPTVSRNVREQDRDARPGIRGRLPDLGGYDMVLIGSPIWNVRAPMIMSTFIEQADLADKRILPFVTYAVSGMADVDEAYRSALPRSTVVDGLAVRGEEVSDAAAKLEAWLRRHQLL